MKYEGSLIFMITKPILLISPKPTFFVFLYLAPRTKGGWHCSHKTGASLLLFSPNFSLLFPCIEHKNLFAKGSCCYSIPTASCPDSKFLLFSSNRQIMIVLIVNSTPQRITQEESINEEFSRTGMSMGDCLKNINWYEKHAHCG